MGMDDGAEALLLADAYGWTPSQIDAMPPYVRRLALDFLSSRTATPRRTPRRQLTALRWRARRALWLRRHRTT